MVGNDVVDIMLSRRESNWQRPGFLAKIFSNQEQLVIYNSIDPEIMVWRLWSMKEAAYKIYNRQTKIRAYIPHQLICTVNGIFGTVTCNEKIYYTETIVDAKSIYTIAAHNRDILNAIVELTDSVVFKDVNGHPFIYNDLQERYQPASVTHHGMYSKVITSKLSN